MKRNIAQLAVEQEASPGAAETIVAADVLVKFREGYTIAPEHELIELEEISDVSSKTPAVIGAKKVTFGSSYILRGPGDLTTDPAIVDLWESALFDSDEAFTIAIGAITTGPYVVGEVITGGTSNATGLVLQQTATGTSSLPYMTLSGTFQTAEVITGGTSAATSTSSAGPIAGGYAFRPADWDGASTGHHATVEGLVDGYYWQGRGCLSDLNFQMSNGRPCIVTQNFAGALSAQGDKVLYTVSAYPEASVTVPKLLNASCYIDTIQPTGIVDLTINWPTNPTFVEDANDSSADGILYGDYRREVPTISIEVDQVLAATYDYFSTLQTGDTVRFEITHGASGSAGTRWTFAAPAAQIRSIGTDERDPSRATFPIELGLTGSANEELLIWQH